MENQRLEKVIKIVEVLVVVVAAVLLAIFKFIPEYKSTLGSSDNYIDMEGYQEIIEVNFASGPNFMIITNSNDKITNLLFLNGESLCLYNKNVENRSVAVGVELLFELLDKEGYFFENPVSIVSYKVKEKTTIIDVLEKNIKKYTDTFTTQSGMLKSKSRELEIEGNSEVELLEQLELYSKELIRKYKNQKVKDSYSNTLTEEEAVDCANNVYKMLLNYSSNVLNQEKDSKNLPIQLIKASNDKDIYPGALSWYYIEDGKVYAFITFVSETYNYQFCYNGTLESLRKGLC